MKDGLRGLLVTDIGTLERDRMMGQEGKSGSGERKVWAKKRREWVPLPLAAVGPWVGHSAFPGLGLSAK